MTVRAKVFLFALTALLSVAPGFLAPPLSAHRALADTRPAAGPPGFVIAVARNEAVWNGDPRPTEADVVPTMRQQANRLDGDQCVDSDQPVYLVTGQSAAPSQE